jgi:hypothetical protein
MYACVCLCQVYVCLRTCVCMPMGVSVQAWDESGCTDSGYDEETLHGGQISCPNCLPSTMQPFSC